MLISNSDKKFRYECKLTKKKVICLQKKSTPLANVDGKCFQIVNYLIILEFRKFIMPTTNRFSTARQKPIPILARIGLTQRRPEEPFSSGI